MKIPCRYIGWVLFSVVVVLFPATEAGAEGFPLKHVLSIYADNVGNGFRHPEGVSCSRWPEIVVADSGNGRLLVVTMEGEGIGKEEEIRLPQVGYPIRVQVDSKGQIFVLDGKNRRIARIDGERKFAGYFEGDGAGVPQNPVPRSFKIDKSNNLYIIDVFSGKLFAFDPAGKLAADLVFPEDAVFISDVTVDGSGTLFLLDSVRSVVYSAVKGEKTFRPVAAFLDGTKDKMRFPTSIEAGPSGLLFITDQNGGTVLIFDRDGELKDRKSDFGWKEGQLNYPSQICLSEKGYLAIADRENNRIQLFSILR